MKNRDREAFKEITFYSLLCDIYLSRMGISCWHITNTFLNLLENWLLYIKWILKVVLFTYYGSSGMVTHIFIYSAKCFLKT